MSLETVVEDIREEAKAEAAEIRSAGDEEAEEIVAAAEEDAEATLADAEREVEQRISREREQRLSSAELEAKQARLRARRDVLERVYERVAERLEELPADRREELLRTLLDGSAETFDEEVVVHCRSEDRELLSDVLADYDGYELGDEIECIGGVVLESEASRVRVNDTFDALLEDVWENNLKAISDRLFEQ